MFGFKNIIGVCLSAKNKRSYSRMKWRSMSCPVSASWQVRVRHKQVFYCLSNPPFKDQNPPILSVMDDDIPTLKPRLIQNQNVVHRLERRRICSGRPGAHWYRVRCFHQNLFPNFTVVNVEKPPCFLRKFSPDGRCFIAFSSDQTSLEVRGTVLPWTSVIRTPAEIQVKPNSVLLQIYEYQGCQAAQDLLRNQEGETLSTDQRFFNIRGRLFERFFSLLHVTNVASNGEHLNRECSLFTDDCRYVIVGSAVYVPEEPPPYFFEVRTLTSFSLSSVNKSVLISFDLLPGVSQQWVCDSKSTISPGRLLPSYYWPPHGSTVWHQVL